MREVVLGVAAAVLGLPAFAAVLYVTLWLLVWTVHVLKAVLVLPA